MKHGRAELLRAMYGGCDDEELAELALLCPALPQPESLERYVRLARVDGRWWPIAAANALSQLFGIEARSRRL